MADTSTIDQHAVNRAKLIEALAAGCARMGFTAADLTDPGTRAEIVDNVRPRNYWSEAQRRISDTVWACLYVRLSGE